LIAGAIASKAVDAAAPEISRLLAGPDARDSMVIRSWSTLLHLNRYVFGPIGCTGVFGATILGWVPVARIRRSAGRLEGLGLAVFDGLLFPLLALDGVLIGGFWFIALSIVARMIGQVRDPRAMDHLFIAIIIFLTGVSSILVDWLIVRRV